MSNNVPITNGQGQSSVAAEEIGTVKYQQIKVVGGETGSTSVLGVNPDRSLSVSVIGTPNVNVSGSVVAYVTGTQITSIVSTVPSSVLVGASIFGQLPGGTAVLGSIATLQGTNPWVVVGSVYGAGSVAAYQAGPWTTSIVSTVPSSVIVGASIFGLAPVNITNTNVNVSGSVAAFQAGTTITSLVSTVPSSVIVGASIFGLAPVNVTNTNLNIGGSVVAFQGTTPWANTNVGSVVTINQTPSIVGTYFDDAAHAVGGTKGIFVLGVRHDTLASVTSATGDYSHFTVGPSGETVVADAPFTKWVSGVADLRVVLGASVTAIAAQGASVFTYVREVQVANFGPSSVLVKIAGGLGSTLGWTIAPAGGGSNFTTRYKTGENSAVTASLNGTASVLVTISGFTASI